jgi:hypothetical protein
LRLSDILQTILTFTRRNSTYRTEKLRLAAGGGGGTSARSKIQSINGMKKVGNRGRKKHRKDTKEKKVLKCIMTTHGHAGVEIRLHELSRFGSDERSSVTAYIGGEKTPRPFRIRIYECHINPPLQPKLV